MKRTIEATVLHTCGAEHIYAMSLSAYVYFILELNFSWEFVSGKIWRCKYEIGRLTNDRGIMDIKRFWDMLMYVSEKLIMRKSHGKKERRI